jgi:hypothetical protein
MRPPRSALLAVTVQTFLRCPARLVPPHYPQGSCGYWALRASCTWRRLSPQSRRPVSQSACSVTVTAAHQAQQPSAAHGGSRCRSHRRCPAAFSQAPRPSSVSKASDVSGGRASPQPQSQQRSPRSQCATIVAKAVYSCTAQAGRAGRCSGPARTMPVAAEVSGSGSGRQWEGHASRAAQDLQPARRPPPLRSTPQNCRTRHCRLRGQLRSLTNLLCLLHGAPTPANSKRMQEPFCSMEL